MISTKRPSLHFATGQMVFAFHHSPNQIPTHAMPCRVSLSPLSFVPRKQRHHHLVLHRGLLNVNHIVFVHDLAEVGIQGRLELIGGKSRIISKVENPVKVFCVHDLVIEVPAKSNIYSPVSNGGCPTILERPAQLREGKSTWQ
jgi:hypothetical protein